MHWLPLRQIRAPLVHPGAGFAAFVFHSVANLSLTLCLWLLVRKLAAGCTDQ
jgi:hypothetical protein